MNSTKFKALLVTILIFGGIGYILFGGGKLPDLPDMSSLKNIFSKDKNEIAASSSSSRKRSNTSNAKAGQVVDNYKGVKVFYNGSAGNVYGRNVTDDGYNLGLKYQCVEFAKRFYYQAYNHKMADSYGHAKDFFDTSLSSGDYNNARGMFQYRNRGSEKPKVDDLCVIGPSAGNQFGHLFIITKVNNSSIEFIQQNGGYNNPSRGRYELINQDGTWNIKAANLVGWLRMGS
jgi:hypothetical protein